MDPIKDAFSKVKQDIELLNETLSDLTHEIQDIKRTIQTIQTELKEIKTNQQINPTPQNIPTDKHPQYGLLSPNKEFSTGNRGVPTDRQTNQQTDRHIILQGEFEPKEDKISHLKRVSEILESLDSIKKDLRAKFKRLTSQEMLIFSTIYQLEEEGFIVDYSAIAGKLKLSESSIRDYTLKIINKGIPLIKNKENNKKITLSVPQDLKKVASLQTILALREI